MKGFVYILKSDDGKYYIGSTTDLERRLGQHYSGREGYTKGLLNPRLVLKQEYPFLDQARRIEKRIKKFKRKDFIDKIVADGVIRLK